MLSLKSWAESNIGQKRINNEDSFCDDPALGLFIVADGMGGHRGGDRASQIAVLTAKATYEAKINEHLAPPLALDHAFIEAAKKVHEESLANADLMGMGTTLSALVISNDHAFIAHIGDTRIYCARDGLLHQLTSDHSLVNEQVQAGILTQEDARISPLRNIITRAIGHNENVRADYFSLAIKKDDIFLLCSDGLNNMLLDGEISKIISTFPPQQAVRELIAEANRNGGDDNITAILVKVFRS